MLRDVSGSPEHESFDEMNVTVFLEMAADTFPDRPALICGDERYTYGALREAARAMALRIRRAGVAHVSLVDVNSPAAAIALFAAAYAGVPYVPLNYRLTRAELNDLVRRITPACIIVNPESRSQIEEREDVQLVSREEVLRKPVPRDGEPLAAPEDPETIAVMLFTSGTTGKPKAAVLRHRNLTAYILGTVEFASAEEDEAALVAVPPYHIAGVSAILSSVYACRRIVQMPSFDAAEWLRLCRRERITSAFLVPTMLQRIVAFIDAGEATADLPALRALAYGGGKMPLATIQRAMELFPHVDFTNAYGLTETSSTITLLSPEDHRQAARSDDPYVRRRLGSVGRSTGAVQIQIRGPQGEPLGPDQPGEVYVRGPQVAGEYRQYGNQLDSDGWFATRDRGWLDRDGYLFLEGRADDIIVRGGENISPGEVEEVLLSHPDVTDAAVVAMPDEQWGEAVAAAVVLREGAQATAEELQALVRARLRSSRVPQAIVFKDRLPYNEMGKLMRRVIRDEFFRAAQPAVREGA